jgi:hypothetical protein
MTQSQLKILLPATLGLAARKPLIKTFPKKIGRTDNSLDFSLLQYNWIFLSGLHKGLSIPSKRGSVVEICARTSNALVSFHPKYWKTHHMKSGTVLTV